MWECCKCHERQEDSFDVCWNCGTSKDGTEDPSFRRAGDSAPTEEDVRAAAARGAVCAKCGSRDLIPNVCILDQGAGSRGGLQVEVYENPSALLFKRAHRGTLAACVCGSCGYAELYVSNAHELLASYRQGLVKKVKNDDAT